MLLATFFVALLGYIFATTPTAYAATASWDGTNVIYEGNTYAPLPSGEPRPRDIRDTQPTYRYVDTTADPDLIHFISFASGVANPQAEKEATYVRYTLNPPNRYVDATNKQTIIVTPAPTAATPPPDTEDGAVTDTCTIDGIGWIVCPIMQGLAEGMDFIYERIRSFLTVQPISTSVDNPIYRIWVYSRDLANIAFIIGFLVIIYSYLVGGGFTGYEIRKILPRLAIAAILINLSYILSAVAVDISNIAGYGINQLFENVRDEVLPGSSAGNGVSVNWTSVSAWVLAGGAGAVAGATILPAAIGGSAAGLWFLLAPFLVGAALLVMVTFIILAARQAIIIILIAIAPLACAAFILPNTEKWFERWRNVFFTMLVMFPAFAAVFGGSQLAGELIIRTASSIEQVILGLGVMVAPLAITPLLLKLGGGVLNRFGGIVNNSQKGVFDRFKNYNNERRSDFLAKQQHRNAQRDENGNLVLGKGQFMRRAAYRQDLKKYNRQRLRDAHTGAAQALYEDNDEGIETTRSKLGRRYANAMNRPYDPSYKFGSEEIAGVKHRTELLKGYTHARHDEHWQHELGHSPQLRNMLTDTRTAEGRAKVMSGAMEAQDERTFQTALNTDASATYANLRDMKVQTSVDSGIAEVQKASIEAAGKLALSNTVSADRALVDMKSRTFANEKSAETIDNILKVTAERDYTSSNEGRTLNIRSQVAQDNLEYTKAAEAALIQEWRTVEGAKNLTGEQATLAAALREADYEKRIETQRGGAAKRQSDMEYALDMRELDTNGNPKVIAVRAGGIEGDAGTTQARATAFQTIVEAQNKGVAAAKTLLSRDENSDLLTMLSSPDILDKPTEQISAIGGTIAGRYHQESHIKLWDRMSELYDQANAEYLAAKASGDDVALAIADDKLGKVKDLQQQVMGDKKKDPFGVGDKDKGDATVGSYHNNIYKTTRERLKTHMSAAKLSSMDPDDLRLIFEMARAGKLDQDELDHVKDAYEKWQNDDNLKALIEDKHRQLLDPIAAYATTNNAATAFLGKQPNPDPPDPADDPDYFDTWAYKFNVDKTPPHTTP